LRVAPLLLFSWSLASPPALALSEPTDASAATAPSLGTESPTDRGQVAADYGQLPLSFELNQGQADGSIDYLAHGSGYSLALKPDQALLGMRTPEAVVGLQVLDASPAARGRGEQPLPGTVNYLVGNDPSQWHTAIPTYAAVHYASVYPGIDLVYHGQQGQLEYDFDVAPGADAGSIHLAVQGADQVELTDGGDLLLHTPTGELRQPKPMLYQLGDDGQRQAVDGGYVLDQVEQQRVSFWVGTRDPSRQLVIDPVLVYSTFLGGSAFGQSTDVAVDAAGNAYVTGDTDSTDFPTTPGAFQPTYRGSFADAFVSKLNPSGTALVYSTFLGGSSDEEGNGIAVDAAGNAYVTGYTRSTDFPITPGAFQPSRPGSQSPFVSKLNPTGTALVYSTFLGGSSNVNVGTRIAADAAGNAYVTGYTLSPDFPTTPGAFQPTFRGDEDAFVSKMNASGTALVYSTFLGGSGLAEGFGIAVDAASNAYVTGENASSDFPTTQGAFQPTFGGNADAFVSKLNPSGAALVYSTFLGGSSFDEGLGIAVDAASNAYVTGGTDSSNFPTTPGAIQPTFRGGLQDAFVSKLNPSGAALVYSTFLGGSTLDTGDDIAVDAAGSAYVTGRTQSADFQTTPGAVQPTFRGGPQDAFVSKLNPSGAALVYSTFLGGSGFDEGFGIALDASASAYVSGQTNSADFPTTPGAFQPRSGTASFTSFVTKIATQLVACSTTLSGAQGSLVIQPNGTTCLQNATVSGSVQVRPGARVFVEHSSTTGPIVADAPAFFGLCDSSVRGSVTVADATGFVLVGDPTDDACGGNTIGAGVVLQNNHSGAEVAANHISGSVSVSGTTGSGPFPEDQGAEIEGNVIGGSLVCSGNNPAPKNDGQPNTVTAARSGQCAGL
jgi:hypothetical protein